MHFIFPPRPKGAVPPHELPYFEKQGTWCVQPKLKGARNVITVFDGIVNCYGRHGRNFQSYNMPENVKKEILALPGLKKGVNYVFDSEVMIKTKAQDTKGKIILFDILQYDKYLFMNPNQKKRLELLDEICGRPRNLDPWRAMVYQISENVTMAPTYYSDFANRFSIDYGEEVEGLVLRKLDLVIDNYGQKEYEVTWMIRCRKPDRLCNF